MKPAPALAITLALAGCTGNQTIAQFTLGDLRNAAALAADAGDSAGAACWTALEPAAQPSPDPASDGAAVLAERVRIVRGAVKAASCAEVILDAELAVAHIVNLVRP